MNIGLAGIDEYLACGEDFAIPAAISSTILPQPDVVDEHFAAHRLVYFSLFACVF